MYSSEGAWRPEYRVQRPLDLASRIQRRAKPLDRELEEVRRTHRLAAVFHAKELADFASDEVVGSVTHGGSSPQRLSGAGFPKVPKDRRGQLHIWKLVVCLLGQDPPCNLDLRRGQADLAEKRRQCFQPRR